MIVVLTANGSADRAVLARGAFLSMLVVVSNPDAGPVEVGSRVAPWWTKVTVLDDRGRQMYWPFEHMAHYPAESVLTLAEGGTAELELGMSPEEFDLEDSGAYTLSVSVDVAGTAEPVVSNPVEIVLLDTDMSEEEASSPDHMAALAAFFTKRGRHVDARAVIDQLLQSGKADMSALLLLGELQEQLGDREGAVRTYEHAERLFWEQQPDSYEGPELIASRIVRLRRA